MGDEKTGISIRFVKQYDVVADTRPTSPRLWDIALDLAMNDEREIPFGDKLRDAWAFIASRRVTPSSPH